MASSFVVAQNGHDHCNRFHKAEKACPPGYRLPSKDEFNLFIPDLENKISFTNKVAYRIIGDGIDCTAYRYELVGNFEEGAVDSQLKITGRYLGDNYPEEITEDTISDESWWGVHNENDIVRIFPAAGNYSSSSLRFKGEKGLYWSSTCNESLSSNVWCMHSIVVESV